MPTFTCQTCLQEFTKKDRYDSHLARKNPCKPPKAVKELIEEKVKEEVKKNNNVEIDSSKDKEKLQSFFEDLHNLLWNKAGLSPEKALDHMTFFFAYRLIEIQADSLNLPKECRWSYVANMNNENDIFETIKIGCISFQRIEITKPFFKKPEIQKADVVYDIIKLINRIPIKTLQETDTLGDIFEYMLSRGMSTMADEGQYFTNRKICNLAFKLSYSIKQTVFREDGSLCTFADWFCGTGGFPAEYVKGVKSIHKDIDWKTHANSINCQDMNMSSVTTTLLNMLILTGVPFSDKKIRSGNSFSDPITIGQGSPFENVRIDYCFMNPPYGGDKTKGKEYKFAYAKGKGVDKKYLVNKEIQSIGIEDDDKVSAGVQLAMATLAPGGVCAIILPQGFFFGASKKVIELRKKLIEGYKIWFVVDIASGSFINTGTKTSMLVFQKGVGPTETVKFIDPTEKDLAKADLVDLQNKSYSLNYKQYRYQNVVEVEGFEMTKLGDICDIHFGERITKKDNIGTKYPVYGGGDDTFRTDKKNREGITCKISRFGISEHNCVQIINGEYWLMDSGFTITAKEDKAISSYVWNWLLQNKNIVYECARATAQMNMDMDTFKMIQIHLPSLETQAKIVDAIDGWSQLSHQEEQNLKLLEKQVMFELKEIGKGAPRVKLGDICDINCGKPLPKTEIINGIVPVIGGGVSPMGFHNEYNQPPFVSIISQRGSAGYISRYPINSWITPNALVLKCKDNEKLINDDVLYFTLKNEQWSIDNIVEKTAQPLLTITNLKDIQIPVSLIVDQEQLQIDFDEIRHKHEKIAYYKMKAEESIQRLIPKLTFTK